MHADKLCNRVIEELYMVEIDAKAEILQVFSPFGSFGEG
jgi:hypothetical protein